MNMVLPMAGVISRPRNRVATRLIMEMQVDGVATLMGAFGGNFDRAIIFFALLRESSEIRRCATGTVCAEYGQRPGMSVNALAASLARPFETVRRHVNALIEAGLCVRDGQQVRGAPGDRLGAATAARHHGAAGRGYGELRLAAAAGTSPGQA
jgi:hypothetical protein